jgi:hypothetical protein
MKNLKLKTHLISALAVSFFLFLAYGSDDSKTTDSNSNTSSEQPQQETKIENEPVQHEQETTAPPPTNYEAEIQENKSSYIGNLKRCVEIANEVSKTDDEVIIENLKQEGLKCQAKAYNAFLALQNPDYNFPYDKIKSMKTVNPIFFGFEGAFSDERILQLPALEYKTKVQEQLEKFNSTVTDLDNF